MAIVQIKNMVCDRCKMAVKALLEEQGLVPGRIELGEIEIVGEPSPAQYKALSENLLKIGFEVIDSSNARIVEKIKNTVVELVHYSNEELKINYSDYIAQKLGRDYTYLSNLFSESEGTTLEKFIIRQKIERVKELLEYGELTLSEIANEIGYSNVAYLSSLFKKVTGMTPSRFKESRQKDRKPLDKL